MALSPEQIETLKQVDNSIESAVNGYIRETQKSLDIKREIPIEIIQFILVFYYSMQYEYFDIHADDIGVSGDYKDIITKGEIKCHYYGNATGDWHNTTFGAVSISSMSDNIVIWTFEMLENFKGTGLSLGIINSKDARIESTKMDLSEEDGISSYMYCSACAFYVNGRKKGSYAEELGIAKTKIKMELNLKEGHLIYYKNGKSFGVACKIKKGQDIDYKLAVTLHWPGAKFKLINFECL